jgi:hypothetical protein
VFDFFLLYLFLLIFLFILLSCLNRKKQRQSLWVSRDKKSCLVLYANTSLSKVFESTKMKKLVNDPNEVVEEMLEGLTISSPSLKLLKGANVIVRADCRNSDVCLLAHSFSMSVFHSYSLLLLSTFAFLGIYCSD